MHPREARFLLAATLLHTAIPLMAWIAERPAPSPVALSNVPYSELEIDLRPVEPLRPEEDQAPVTAPRAPEETRPREERTEEEPRRRAGLTRRVPGELPPPSPEAPAAEPQGSAAPAAPPSPRPEYGGPPSADRAPGVAGLDGVPVWQLPGVLPERAPSPRAPTAPPAPREIPADRANALLREAMLARDKALGLDLPAAGTIASVVAEVARSSETPASARAVFEVHLSGAGQVLGVRALSSTAGGADLWTRIAREAAARLAGRVLAMTAAFVKGAKVYVTVTSSVKLPSGAAGAIAQEGAGISFDVSDLGAKSHRVISSSFRVEAME